MLGRLLLSRAEPGFTLPAFERLAPPPPPNSSSPGSRRIGAGRHRRRPPRPRRLGRPGGGRSAAARLQPREQPADPAARRGRAAAAGPAPPRRRVLRAVGRRRAARRACGSIDDLFATRCAHVRPERRRRRVRVGATRSPREHYRCTICRDQRAGPSTRPPSPTTRTASGPARGRRGGGPARLRERFPVPDGGDALVDAILGCTPIASSSGLAAILDRIEGDLRAAPVESALRLAFLHAVLPASRLGLGGARIPALRIAGGGHEARSRSPGASATRGSRSRRASGRSAASSSASRAARSARWRRDSARTSGASPRARQRGRPGHDPGALETLADEARDARRRAPGSGSCSASRRPVQPGAPRGRLSRHCWALGREAASLLPLEPLLGPAIRAPWSWQAATLRRSLEAVAPHLARDGRVVLLLEHGGPEALVAAVLGGVGAGYRLVEARLSRPGRRGRRRRRAGAARRRAAARAADPEQRPARGDRAAAAIPELVPGPGLFAPPERIEARPFSAREAAATIMETAVEVLRARGEPARYERLLGEILVGLDRSGPAAPARSASRGGSASRRRAVPDDPGPAFDAGPGMLGATTERRDRRPPRRPFTRTRTFTRPAPPRDPVERVLALVREELSRPDQHRVVEIEPGRWWLGDRRDREAAAVPLADRVEWAVYSLLSTAGPIAETRVLRARRGALLRPRPARRDARPGLPRQLPQPGLHREPARDRRGPPAPDRRAHRAARPPRQRRPSARDARLARPARAGAPDRRSDARRLPRPSASASRGSRRARSCPKEDGEAIDCIWYQRGGSALLFEVEWTAMLGDVLLRRHARIPAERADGPLPRHRAGAARARAPQARVVADPARRDGGGELAHHPVAPPPGLARARPARPRGPRAVSRPRSARSSAGPSRWACSSWPEARTLGRR